MIWFIILGMLTLAPMAAFTWRLSRRDGHMRSYVESVLKRHGRRMNLLNATAAIVLNRSLFALCVHRLSYRIGHPIAGRLLTNLTHFLTGIEIYYNATIGRDVEIWHGQGTVIGQNARIGDRCLILHQVTLGSGFVVLEDEVKVGAGAKILGNVTVGVGSVVGANAVVTRNVAARTLVKPDGRAVPMTGQAPISFGTRA